MSAASEVLLVDPTIVVVPWHDDVVDLIGHDLRSTYVETFWLNVFGPTATWLLRRMATGLDEYPGGYELDLDQTASALGLVFTPGAANPFARSMQRHRDDYSSITQHLDKLRDMYARYAVGEVVKRGQVLGHSLGGD